MPESKPYKIDPQAWQEIEAADDWYRQRSVDASVGFLAAIADGIQSICRWPTRWPRHLSETRRFPLHRFPFSIIYLDEPEVVNIVAIAHSKRKPGYWTRRI